MGLAAIGVEPVGVRRDAPEELQGVGHEVGPRRCRFDRQAGEALRLVEAAEDELGATERAVGV